MEDQAQKQQRFKLQHQETLSEGNLQLASFNKQVQSSDIQDDTNQLDTTIINNNNIDNINNNNITQSDIEYSNISNSEIQNKAQDSSSILYILHNQDLEFEDSDDEYENGINSQLNKDYQYIYLPLESEENPNDFYIGREGKGNGIYSKDQHISRKHIEIQYNQNKEEYFFYDISKNGVWVRTFNRLLHNGQIFMMGNFQYQIDQVSMNQNGQIELHLLISHNDIQFDGINPDEDDEGDIVRSILYFDDNNQEKQIGRDPKQCNLVQDDLGLSPVHIKIQKYGNKLQIMDMDSLNGLWIKSRQSTKTERKPYKIENNMEVKLAHVKVIKFKLIKKLQKINQQQQNKSERYCLYCKDDLTLIDLKSNQKNIRIPKNLVNNPICQICQKTFNVKESKFYSCFCNNIGFYMCYLCTNLKDKIQEKFCQNCNKNCNELIMIGECYHMFCHICIKNNFNKKCLENNCKQIIKDFIDIEYI